jgi:hypothetical protein
MIGVFVSSGKILQVRMPNFHAFLDEGDAEAHHPELRGLIREAGHPRRILRRRRDDVDDEPLLLGAHRRERRVEQVVLPGEIDPHDEVEVLRRQVLHPAPIAEDVEPALLTRMSTRSRLRDQLARDAVDLGPVGHVEGRDHRSAALGGDLPGHLVELRPAPAHQRHRRALAREHEGSGPADARARPRDPHDLAAEQTHDVLRRDWSGAAAPASEHSSDTSIPATLQ